MESQVQDELNGIVAEFSAWVKSVATKASQLKDGADVQKLEMELRDGGRGILLKLLQQMLQKAVDKRKESTRGCPHCHTSRRHRGVRSRQYLCSLGSMVIQGVYWQCSGCDQCEHSADGLMAESMSKLMRGLVCLLGVSLASFDKAELVARRVLGVEVDDNTIRRMCQKEGWSAVRQQDAPPVPVKAGEELIGSCDGTSVRTRESGWRELKAFRFEHDGGKYGGAYLENAQRFVPRMVEAAGRIGANQAGRLLFLSDSAVWITEAVKEHLPGWKHIADYWHACQHLFAAGALLYGKDKPRARQWGRYWSKRLRWMGASAVEKRLRSLSLFYEAPANQRAVLDVAAFLDRHASRMEYAAYEAAGWTISSGPMESFCKQPGLRMKGPGMRWNEGNVSPMASLVSRWSLDAENCELFGACPSAN